MRLRHIVHALILSAITALSARADVVTDWNAAALDAIRAAATPPPVAARALAILHASIYDAVNGIARSHEPYFVSEGAPVAASKEAAAAAAAHRALVVLFPARSASFATLRAEGLATIPDTPVKAAGIAWGTHVADVILAWRATDGADRTAPPPPFVGAGYWQPTPPSFAPYLLAAWGTVTPFGLASGPMFRPHGPPALDSAKYAADYNEVKALGAAVRSARTADQTEIALFWADGGGTETPPGHWNHIARDVAAATRNSLEENSRLFALLNIAMADAAICAWDSKYFYDFWRPVTAIHNGDQDGNAATDADPTWRSLLATPPFPDYVSGHSTFSGAAATVLALYYGTDRVAFATGSDFLPGVVRHFGSFSAAALEAGISRVYGGIHYRAANDDGLAAGAEVGAWTLREHMQRRSARRRTKD